MGRSEGICSRRLIGLSGRRLFAGAMLLFGPASLGCAVSLSLTAFTAARIVQVLPTAVMTPVGRIIVLRETPKSALVYTMALLTWPALLAPAIARSLDGLIVEHLSWRALGEQGRPRDTLRAPTHHP